MSRTIRETTVVARDPATGGIHKTLSVERSADDVLISRKEFAALQRDIRQLDLAVEALRGALAVFGVEVTLEGPRVRTKFSEHARALSQPNRNG